MSRKSIAGMPEPRSYSLLKKTPWLSSFDERIDSGWGITKHELKALACSIGKARVGDHFSVGEGWYQAFMKRHKQFTTKRTRSSLFSTLIAQDPKVMEEWWATRLGTDDEEPEESDDDDDDDDEDKSKPKKTKKKWRVPREWTIQRVEGYVETKKPDVEQEEYGNIEERREALARKCTIHFIKRDACIELRRHDNRIKKQIRKRFGKDAIVEEVTFSDEYDTSREDYEVTSSEEEEEESSRVEEDTCDSSIEEINPKSRRTSV
ncbi:hypothetical protein Cantr_06717 [Candida viswanathii]|uniref:HTH CENPB-type domain-containing protein n=1 Tax=Candida viswanathii TaxID=5486 RepID=A0A367XUX1_9ASCO|nr:hypothetical protein Cantr_06717 [Candida viswanathii]